MLTAKKGVSMAGSRTQRKDRFTEAKQRKLLSETPEVASGRPTPELVTSLTVASAARKSLKQEENLAKKARAHALTIIDRWAQPDAPQAADSFWCSQANIDRYGFYRTLHPLGSTVVAHCAVADLESSRPSETVTGPFDPDRQEAARRASAALLAAAGSGQLVSALELAIPWGITVVTESGSWWREGTKVPLRVRLPGYDLRTLNDYSATLPGDQYVAS